MVRPPVNIEVPEELLRYLRAASHIGPEETPRLTVLRGGVSNRTVLVERANGSAWVIKQSLAQLRVATEWFSDLARVHREAAGLRWLGRMIPGSVPDFIFEDHDQHVLAMSAVPQPHVNWKDSLLAGQLEEAQVAQFAQLLARIHQLGSVHLDEVAATFADRSSLESLRLEPYYHYTAEQVPPAADLLHALIEETRATRLTLVHGDYSPKNVLLRKRQLILVDHEIMHFGDPALDIGFALSHLLSKAHHLAAQRERFAAASLLFWREYQRHNPAMADVVLQERAVRHGMACVLARAAGRSPLEYLDESARAHQVEAVLPLFAQTPSSMSGFVARFCERL